MTPTEDLRSKAMELALAWTKDTLHPVFVPELIQAAAQIEEYLRRGAPASSLAG